MFLALLYYATSGFAGPATIYKIVFPILAFIFLFSIIAIFWLRRHHRLRTERAWKIEYANLHWDDPPIILGTCCFMCCFNICCFICCFNICCFILSGYLKTAKNTLLLPLCNPVSKPEQHEGCWLFQSCVPGLYLLAPMYWPPFAVQFWDVTIQASQQKKLILICT